MLLLRIIDRLFDSAIIAVVLRLVVLLLGVVDRLFDGAIVALALRLVVPLLGIVDRLFDGAIIAVVLRLIVFLLSFNGAIIAVTPAITIAAVTCQIDQISFPHRLQFCG